MKPAKHQFSILKQIKKLVNKHVVSQRCRAYSPWSYVVSLIYVQLSHALNLNDICDSQHLRLVEAKVVVNGKESHDIHHEQLSMVGWINM